MFEFLYDEFLNGGFVCEEFLKTDFVRLFLSYPIFSDFVMKITITIKERSCRLLKRMNVFHTSFMKFEKFLVGNLKGFVCGVRHICCITFIFFLQIRVLQ